MAANVKPNPKAGVADVESVDSKRDPSREAGCESRK